MFENLPGNMQTGYYEKLSRVIGEIDNKFDKDLELFLNKPEHIEYFRKRKSQEVLGRPDGSWEEIYAKIPSFYRFFFVKDFIEKIKSFVNVLYYTHIDHLTAIVIVESINPEIYKYIYQLVPPGCDLVLFNKTLVRSLYGGFYIGQPTIISHKVATEGLKSYNFMNRDLVFLPHGAVISGSQSLDISKGSFKIQGQGEVKLIRFESGGQLSIRLEPEVAAEIYIDDEFYIGPVQAKPFSHLKVRGEDIEFKKIIVRMEG